MSMENLRDIDAVIFDMDGVLIDTMEDHAQAWLDVLTPEGVLIRREDVYEHEGEAALPSLRCFFEINHRDAGEAHLQELIRRKETLFKQRALHKPFPGVAEFLRQLRLVGKRMAIVTGTARHELAASLPQDLADYFETIVTGDEVRHGKPHPEPYLKALQALALAPERAVVIENAPLGVRSARGANLRCFAVETSMQCHRLVGAERCFADIISLAGFLLGKPLEIPA
ncbi:MAG: HAD family phosphatase [Candidatus Firestonebacteria bacterium]|nr:HAD family phosphatase [Candidatus Firestonebacteria bacterium]